jgi:hypothetical protein
MTVNQHSQNIRRFNGYVIILRLLIFLTCLCHSKSYSREEKLTKIRYWLLMVDLKQSSNSLHSLINVLVMRLIHMSLRLNLHSTPFKLLRIASTIRLLVMSSHKEGSIREQVVHLLQRQVLCLRKEKVEEESVGKITNDEEKVVTVTNVCHCDASDLSDESVEGEGYHSCD